MYKHFITLTAAALAGAIMVSCGNDSDNPKESVTPSSGSSYELDYTDKNASSWHNYMKNVANLLKSDAEILYSAWSESYNGGAPFASQFKNHNDTYSSAWNCIEEILGGCIDIATEVGESKIGDPYTLYRQNQREKALYAVESWYSWHSRDDYANNIRSIRNSYFCSTDNQPASGSFSSLVSRLNPELDSKVISAIDKAQNAIFDIPQPFRNNIGSSETVTAMDACAELESVIDIDLTSFLVSLSEDASNGYYEAEFDAIVDSYVDNVVLPTYRLLVERNRALYNAVTALTANPTDSNFEAACSAWLEAREPWEKSEAFLFGPVDALGLDPNMDSWPLDVDAIVNHINSGNFEDLNWGEDDDDMKIEAAQNIRGFHTLEFLLFKDGNPRKANK